ncbi:helix-turn-helix transcriptional regulator [Streptosporangium sp. NPDC020145]|uniref:helix-turn-helix domain-containing protein n=1 Tax=Streptosporangium sp. NPDC020145 TaxID=3154694 RepID=UPI00343FD3E8
MGQVLSLPFSGKRLRELRERRGWSQTEFARIVDVHQSRISQLENARTRPMPGLLKAMALALEVEIDDLLAPQDGES